MKATWAAAGVLAGLLLLGGGALGYARWSRPIAEADAALASGDFARALERYRHARGRFDALPPVRQIFTSEYARLAANELWLLYRLQRYDESIDAAERAPEEASPHFWAGCAFISKARAQTNPEARLGWLSRAEDEFRRAVEAAPTDWDTKFDFELASRLAAELRRQPKAAPQQLMQLLRPQPQGSPKPPRRVG